MMRREKLDHLLRAASTVTGHRCFVLVGSAAILIRCKNIPGDMLLTPEADLYVPDVPNAEDLSDAIEANIGQGSSFHQQYGYYCDGVSAGTAVMPADWQARAVAYESPAVPVSRPSSPIPRISLSPRWWLGGRRIKPGSCRACDPASSISA